jgi:hypothetical protein
MVTIPFSLVGIMPAHGLLGAFFSATSMIGFMAGQIASLLISRMAVPVLYFMANKTHARAMNPSSAKPEFQ